MHKENINEQETIIIACVFILEFFFIDEQPEYHLLEQQLPKIGPKTFLCSLKLVQTTTSV